jgi:hypothetical protein
MVKDMKIIKLFRPREYLFRHIKNFYPYLTMQKIGNIGLSYVEYKFKISTPRSLPPYIKIEPTPMCQLKCPGCNQSKEYYEKNLIRVCR